MRDLRELDRYRVTDPAALTFTGGWAGDDRCGAFVIPSPLDQKPLVVIASSGEEWLPIPGWSDLYEVSNSGRVRALAKSVPLPHGGARRHEQMELSQEVMEKGYHRVTLQRDGEKTKILVHVLVAQTFIKNPKGFPFVNHRDGNKSRNGVMNVEWCSEAYNQHHAIENGLRTGLTTEAIGQIRDMLANGMAITEIAARMELKRAAVAHVDNGNVRDLNPEEPSRYTGLEPWDHVSVSREKRVPNWHEMSRIHRMFFKDNEIAMQLHVPSPDHINVHPNCLHLWRSHNEKIPLPPSIFV